jgi:DNA-binding PadR family transcriptional regulator
MTAAVQAGSWFLEDESAMNNSDIANTILCTLYESHFSSVGQANLNEICEEKGWDSNTFLKVAHRMIRDGLIRESAAGGNYRITSRGIVHAENQGAAPEELVSRNQQVRTLALDLLAKVYHEKGRYGFGAPQQVCEKADLDLDVVVHNLSVLEDLGYVDRQVNIYNITCKGLEAVEDQRQRVAIAERFETISQMRPQPRGRELQKLLATIVAHQGWSQEEGVRTSHEEMDVIVSREREYYLVECKWEKDAIEAGVIRELYGKLENRVGVRGVVVSMSSFTSGAVKQAEDYASKRIILLFGPDDMRRMVYGQVTFDQLLNEKHKELVARTRIVFN